MPEAMNLLLNLAISLAIKRKEYPEQPSLETEIRFLRTSGTYKHSSKTRVLQEDSSKQNVPMAVTATVAPVPIFKITSPSFSLQVSLNPCNIL